YMLKLWTAIDGASKAGKGAFLIYQESSLVIRAIRDYFTADVGEILIDTDDIYDQAQQFMAHVMPETAHKVKRYRDDAPLFSRFQIEHQIETAFSRTVNLPSGGAIVIDHTEALVSVDVNSARSTRGSDIEETATRTNLEAADEIARQMRLRDLGGLIVVDFIDMEESKNRREVETRLRDALRQDRARVQFSSISKFGLLELSRQRLRPALSEGSHITCPRCNGTGHIRDTESSALQILRMVQEESMKDNTAAVHVQVPVEVTSFLLNEKRTEITKIELKQRVTVLLVPNKNLDTPNYRLERLRHDDPRLENLQASYTMIDEAEEEVGITRREKTKAKQEPVIKGILPETPAPVAAPKAEPIVVAPPVVVAPAAAAAVAAAPAGGGFFSWVKSLFGGEPAKPAVAATAAAPAVAKSAESRDGRGERGDRGERGGRGGRGGRDGKRGGDRGDGRNEGRGEGRGEARGEGRGKRPERTERPAGEEVVRTEALEASRGEERGGRQGNRDENRGEGRGEGRDGRRGPRPDREPRKPNPAPVAASASDEAASSQAFVDTLPGADAPETGEAQGERQGGRRRNRRGGRGGRDRDEASVDGASTEQAQAATGEDQPPAATDAVRDAAEADSAAPRAEGSGETGEGRRRGRGRDRNRRERTDEAGLETGVAAEGVTTASTEPVAASYEAPESLAPAATTSPVMAAEPTQTAAAVAEPIVEAATLAAVMPAAAPAAPVIRVAPVAPAIVAAAAPVAAASAEPFVLPMNSLQAVAESAGLQWVNSDADKIRAVQSAMAAEPSPVHVPRERKPVENADTGPLVLVETRKDLSQIKLPFETAQGSQPQS
ncbi:MAG: ribonuclease E/G, partial [Burkholderiales bacterium]